MDEYTINGYIVVDAKDAAAAAKKVQAFSDKVTMLEAEGVLDGHLGIEPGPPEEV